MSTLTARVFNVQRFSTEDGPGLRTTVFMKGCPLRCQWCHNPEGLVAQSQLAWTAARCAHCLSCAEACPEKAITPGFASGAGLGSTADTGLERKASQGSAPIPLIDRDRCLVGWDDPSCGLACAEACPRKAIEVIGRRVEVGALVSELLRDEVFYRTSGGGVTFSGGESGLQAAFVIEAAGRLRETGVHVAFDTSGHIPADAFERVIAAVDLVLFDLKQRDPAKHKELTGVGLDLIDENAARLGAAGVPAWVRVPVIPGRTDDEENARAIAHFIREKLPQVGRPGGDEGGRGAGGGDRRAAGGGGYVVGGRVDLLAYNSLAEVDYARMGMAYALAGLALCRRSTLERFKAIMEAEGLTEIHISGRFGPEDDEGSGDRG